MNTLSAGANGSLKLSVVLPNYNHARYLPQALDALLAQTVAAELIVIDDASTDDSLSVLSRYQRVHPRIRVITNDENKGVVWNLNYGLSLAVGEYIYFAAADDVVYLSLFETGLSLLQKYPEAALFSARSAIIDSESRSRGVLATPMPIASVGYISPSDTARHLIEDDGWFMGNTTIYRRELLLAVGGFPAELGAFTDGYISRLLALGHGACFSSEVLAAWRRLEGGMAWSQATNLNATRKLIESVEAKMTAEKIFPQKYIERWKRRHLFAALRFALERRPRPARGLIVRTIVTGRDWMLLAWWFVRFRPWDIVTVARRRLAVRRADQESSQNASGQRSAIS